MKASAARIPALSRSPARRLRGTRSGATPPTLAEFRAFLSAKSDGRHRARRERQEQCGRGSAHLHDRKLAKSSIARKLATVRSCFRYLARVAGSRSTRSSGWEPPLPKRLPSFLAQDESKELA